MKCLWEFALIFKLIDLDYSLEKGIIQKNLEQTKEFLSHRWRINIVRDETWNKLKPESTCLKAKIMFALILGEQRRKRGEHEARVAWKGTSAKRSRLSPYHCSSGSGVQIWTRLPNWLLYVIWSSNVFNVMCLYCSKDKISYLMSH